MKLTTCFALCLCLLLVGGERLAMAVDSASVAGVYTVYSTDTEDAGKATLLPGGANDTVTITWELLGSEMYSGVGIIKGDMLSAAWFNGVVVYQIAVNGDEVKLNGSYIEFGASGDKRNETMSRFRKFSAEEIADRKQASEEREQEQFQEQQIVAANYSNDEYWYYAKIIKKIPDVDGTQYLVEYLAGDVKPELLLTDDLSKYMVEEGDAIESNLPDEAEDDFWELTVKSVPENWSALSDTDVVVLQDEQGTTYERPLKALRFTANE